MILSYNVTRKDQDSQNDDSIKEEEINEIETILKQKQEPAKEKPKIMPSGDWSNEISLGDSGQISKIDFKTMSINSSIKDYLSRTEDYIQKEVMQLIENDSSVSDLYIYIYIQKKDKTGNNISLNFFQPNESIEGKIFDISNDISILSQKGKNYVLKSVINNNDVPSKITAPNFNMQFNTNPTSSEIDNTNNNTTKDVNASHNTSSFIKFNNGCINQ